ncbi:hypothetical protein DI270_015915 [Microbispora triticiradicis]|uniref:Uncharacterized protein n=1 Tax=Microbispora triticiradicis TaxID=2200763 RepID=A0ABX9LLR8_9ACTN|nr:hypothetical protein DI270_015915 [Microbispora triticiradicis]
MRRCEGRVADCRSGRWRRPRRPRRPGPPDLRPCPARPGPGRARRPAGRPAAAVGGGRSRAGRIAPGWGAWAGPRDLRSHRRILGRNRSKSRTNARLVAAW